MSSAPRHLADDPSWWPPEVGDFFLPDLLGAGPWVTKITLMVWFAVILLLLFFLLTYRNPQIVPSRGQWLAESLYSFIRDGVCREVIGAQGVRFAPYLATLFSFILITNLFGIIPLLQLSPNSHIAFPAVLAIVSYVLFLYLGVRKHGFFGYFKMNLMPEGAPGWLLPILIPIELASTFVMRPITLAVRLFANMFAGHLILLVFTLGGFMMLAANNAFLMGSSLVAFAMALVMTGFEFIVALIQAYVFVVLTASYVEGALADEH